MKTGPIVTAACLSLCLPVIAQAQSNADTSPGAACTDVAPSVVGTSQIATAPSMLEGVTFDAEGRLFVSETRAHKIYTQSGEGADLELWAEVRFPNGHKVLGDGTHVVQTIDGPLLLAADGAITGILPPPVGAEGYEMTNDMTPDGRGGFWFTDPGSWVTPRPGRIFHADADGVVTLAASAIGHPNGIVARPDDGTLFVSESRANRILSYPIEADGSLGHPSVFADLPDTPTVWDPSGIPVPDGIALDAQGRLYVTQFGTSTIKVIDRDGMFLDPLEIGAPSMTNLSFGFDGESALYVTAALDDDLDGAWQIVRVELPEGVCGAR